MTSEYRFVEMSTQRTLRVALIHVLWFVYVIRVEFRFEYVQNTTVPRFSFRTNKRPTAMIIAHLLGYTLSLKLHEGHLVTSRYTPSSKRTYQLLSVV